jgi:chitinase
MAAPSPTRAAAAMYERSRSELDAFQAKLEAVPRQVGAVFAINGAIVGLELFDNPATWRKSMRKIVESYGLDALDLRDEEKGRARRDPKRFLASVSATTVESFKAVGLGEDLRLSSPQVAGAALAVDQKVVHLLAYAC